MGEYLTGALTEVVEWREAETRLQILSFTTNKKRELVVKCANQTARVSERTTAMSVARRRNPNGSIDSGCLMDLESSDAFQLLVAVLDFTSAG